MATAVRTIFMGSPEFGVPSLHALHEAGYDIVSVYTQPDRPSGRGQQVHACPVARAARELGLPLHQPDSMRGEAEREHLASLSPDVVVIAAYGHILPASVLAIPPHGFLNVHASLLPRHRGAAPVPGAILAGDAETGVTIMQIDPGLDTGPMLAKRATPIGPDDTTGSLLDRLATIGADLLLETLTEWTAGRIRPEPQDDALANLCPQLTRESGEIDWGAPAAEIWRAVRAYNPWPSAFTFLEGERLVIHEAWPIPGPAAEPGRALALDAGVLEALGTRARRAGFAIGTGEGFLVPLAVQKAGRKPLDAAVFARGERALAGALLRATPVRQA